MKRKIEMLEEEKRDQVNLSEKTCSFFLNCYNNNVRLFAKSFELTLFKIF